MSKIMLQAFGAAICTVVSAMPASAAVNNARTVQKKTATNEKTMRSAWPPETLEGKVVMVDPARHLMIVKGQDGVPFDMKWTRATALRSGGERLAPASIDSAKDKDVTVRYRPERSGDVATSVQISARK